MIESITTTLQNVNFGQVTIPAKVVDQARRYLLQHQITKEKLSTYVETELLPVQIQAKRFLEGLLIQIENIQKLMEQAVNLKKAELKVKTGEKNSAIIFSYNQKEFKILGQQLTQSTIIIQLLNEDFSATLQERLTGKRPKITFTPLLRNRKPSPDIYVLDSIKQILSIERKTANIYQPRLRASLSKIKSITEPIDRSQILGEDQAKLLEKTYEQVLNRFSDPSHKYRHSPPTLILWNMLGLSKKDWRGMWLGNQRGDIVEAYQRAVFSRINSLINNFNPPERNIQTFMQLLTQVDSASGTLIADTETNLISAASKLQGAQPAGIQDAVKYASTILDIKTDQQILRYLQGEKILEQKRAKQQGRANVIFDISNDALKELERVVKK